ncbi:hypothetical protein [Mycobacterium sp. OTB74]|jgi:hypothetical protein|uniref:hypothetical protein n=1 Tax=Mycobacterium sp. OTB74 TaxID=1853452 RepID=UPI002476C16D|nr:hypothetical protein [Mycobacterium sp. OTB74]MDH6242834.1 hypothetical protein [Mycobacterium sp. OTB74]
MADEILRIDELRAAVGLALDQFVDHFGDEVVMRPDWYWHLQVEDAFDLLREPGHTVGDLSDDLAEVRSMLAERDAYEQPWHILMHVMDSCECSSSLPGRDRVARSGFGNRDSMPRGLAR